MTPDGDQTNSVLHSWAKSTFEDFTDHTVIVAEVIEMTVSGLSMIRGGPEAVRALHVIHTVDSAPPGYAEDAYPADVKAKIAAAEHRGSLAQREVDSDFNIVHSQAVISLWSALEDVIRTLVARWLLNVPKTKAESPWADLKVRVGDYEQLDDEEKPYYLWQLPQTRCGVY